MFLLFHVLILEVRLFFKNVYDRFMVPGKKIAKVRGILKPATVQETKVSSQMTFLPLGYRLDDERAVAADAMHRVHESDQLQTFQPFYKLDLYLLFK